jgi:hypothetical protein
MKYTKPEIVALAPAISAIESHQTPKPMGTVLDLQSRISNGAYEADE